MPEFPLPPKKSIEEAMMDLGYTPDRAKKIDEIDVTVKATIVTVGPIHGEVDVTADDQDFEVIDTSKIEKVANTPHGIFGWLDCSEFAKLANTNPDATLTVTWIVDGMVYTQATFKPSDFSTEQILYFLERRAIKYHKIIIRTHGTGASSSSPLKFTYSFTMTAGLLPIPP